MAEQSGSVAIARAFIEAFGQGSAAGVAAYLHTDVESYITNGEAGVDHVVGREGFMDRIAAMDFEVVRPKVNVTQVVEVRPGEVLAMAEVNAKRGSRTLHNYGAFLLTVEDDLIVTFRMVDAKPAESDAFWTNHDDTESAF